MALCLLLAWTQGSVEGEDVAVCFQFSLLFCGGDAFLPESRLPGTMVTTSGQGRLPQWMDAPFQTFANAT